ncbi:MAG: hypothetical protein IKU38_00950, partial [Clostridia bacterium]|nr:hypothetical protein [Clostridia bacterium]
MKRKHRLIILLSIFTAMLCLMFAAASADEELHTAHVKLYIEGEFPQPGFRPFRMRGIDFDSYMRTHLANQSKQIDVSQFGMSPDEFYVSFQNMLNRSPSLFYVYGGYSYYESDDIVTSILPVYLYSGSDLTARIARFNAAVDEVVAYARQSSTIEGQLLRANDYLCANYEYDLTYSIYSPDAFFEYKTGVCQAYTMAYGAVLDKLGIAWDTTTSEEMNHIWNLVNIDDDWYHVDVTWNDPIYDVPLRVHHSNFLLSDSGIEKAGHYAWNRSITAESAKYDQYFWSSINQAIPMINDTAYYVQDPSDFSERQVYKFDLNTQKNSLVYEYAVSSSVIWGGHYPLWADNTYLYYADMNKLYRVAHSGGSASAVYDTKDSNQWIWGMFQNGTTLSMHVSPSPANKGKIHTHTISSSVQPVTITRQPVSVAVGKGQTATVSFTAAGEGLTYKWYYKDTTASDFSYSGSFTGNSYSIAISAARSGRQVYCVVTDKYGNSVQTDTVTITMADPVTITRQPVSVTVGKGQTATVSFTATGEGLTYQWYYKDTTASDFSYSGSFTGNSYSIAISAARSG